MSCGPDDAVSSALDHAVDAGIVAVVAAGNSGPEPGTINSPGTSRKAITVGAASDNVTVADFSSRGPINSTSPPVIKPDIVAPGVRICAAEAGNLLSEYKCYDERHINLSGTSMAAPFVAGAAALSLQKNPSLTPLQVKDFLRNGAKDILLDVNTQGKGFLDTFATAQLIITPLIGDLNTDGSINFSDLKFLFSRFFSNDSVADLNRDKKVNAIDFSLFMNLPAFWLPSPTPTLTPTLTPVPTATPTTVPIQVTYNIQVVEGESNLPVSENEIHMYAIVDNNLFYDYLGSKKTDNEGRATLTVNTSYDNFRMGLTGRYPDSFSFNDIPPHQDCSLFKQCEICDFDFVCRNVRSSNVFTETVTIHTPQPATTQP